MDGKSKLYALRDKQGKITALSEEQVTAQWQPVNLDDPAVKAFAVRSHAASQVLEASDLDFIRVLEDLIELLIEKQLISFMDFPEAAQKKMLNRRWYRNTVRNQDAGKFMQEEDDMF